MRIFRLPDIWLRYTPAEWLEHMTPPNHGLRSTAACDFSMLIHSLRQLRPRGSVESHKPMPVILQPGKAVGLHFHKQWTLIYYIDAEEVPIVIDGVRIYPANNTAMLLEPDTPHEVQHNASGRPRLSLAFRFDQPENVKLPW